MQAGTPVGLKNTGNICYLNSLLQVYCRMRPAFFESVLKAPLNGAPADEYVDHAPYRAFVCM